MGQKDLAAKRFFGKKDVFADLVNNYFFKGRKVVNADDLLDRDTEAVLANLESDRLKAKYRDLFKQVAIKEADKATYVLIGIENQAEVDYTMPIRVLLYDALAYEQQRNEVVSKNKNKSMGYKTEHAEGTFKGHCFRPVITLVIYLGSGSWRGPRSLYDSLCSDIPHELSGYINNWQVPIIEPVKMQDDDFNSFTTELGLVMKFLKYCHDKEGLLEVVRKNVGFANVSGEALGIMNSVSKHKLKLIGNGEDGGYNMCKAIDDLIRDSVIEGRNEGRAEEKQKIAINLKKMGMDIDNIATAVNASKELVGKWLSSAPV